VKIGDLLRNKKALYGVGAAAALGLVVLVMRRGGPPGDGPPSSEQNGTTTLQPGTYDSTGSDIYNGIQALGAGWEERFNEIIGKLGDVQSRLPKTPSPTSPLDPKNPGPLKPVGSRKVNAGVVKTLPTSGRWSWLNLAEYWYNLTGLTPAQKAAKAAKLRDANKARWFGKPPGPNLPYTGSTVAGGQPVTLPGSL